MPRKYSLYFVTLREEGIEHASIDELRAVPGIGISMAKKIQNHFEN